MRLINEILDLSKVKSGNLDVSIEAVSWDNAIKDSITFIQNQADANGIQITYSNIGDNPFFVNADQMRLKQISLNLLSNAVKYNKENGQIHISLENITNEFVKLIVKDTGLGIPLKYQQHLFEPFNRLANTATAIEGTGIGLLITKRLTEVMKGEIGFDSTENIGSTFWIKLPAAEIHQHIIPESSQIKSKTTKQTDKKSGNCVCKPSDRRT